MRVAGPGASPTQPGVNVVFLDADDLKRQEVLLAFVFAVLLSHAEEVGWTQCTIKSRRVGSCVAQG